MRTEVSIRRPTAEDVPIIIEMWKELMDFHKERDEFFSRSTTGHEGFTDFITAHIAKDASCVLVAELKENIVGYCLVAIEKYPPVLQIQEYGRVHNLAITKKYRCRGIGKELLREAQAWFCEKGVHRIEARIATSNKLATKFWAKMGFRPYMEAVFLEI